MSDRLLLLVPAARYAAGVDRRDVELFLRAFDADATLTIPPRDGSGDATMLRGHAELSRVVERIARYDTTFHCLGQSLIDRVDDTVAHGEVYCTAHHWRTVDDRREHMTMYIRYADAYRRGDDGEWRIATRSLHVDAREIR
jgi:hypothetical protein